MTDSAAACENRENSTRSAYVGITVTDGERDIILGQEDLFRVYESEEGGCVCLETRADAFPARQTLEELEAVLDPEVFVRIRTDEIANLTKVFCFDVTISGDVRLLYRNGTESFVERRYLPVIREKLRGNPGGETGKEKGKRRGKKTGKGDEAGRE